MRATLLEARKKLPKAICDEHTQAVLSALILELKARDLTEGVGLYWPFAGEIDVLPFAEQLNADGVALALPVVVAKNTPLEFWRWKPGDALSKGVYDIPYPSERELMEPGTLVVPVVGFDESCFRLGYGGGFYDRTLVAFERRPWTIGVGFSTAKLDTIYPQSYDVPLDVILTETGSVRR